MIEKQLGAINIFPSESDYKKHSSELADNELVMLPVVSDLLLGKDAYHIAIDNGFSGSEKEWLASIKGEKGDKGDIGVVFTPSISSDGVLSWTNDGGLTNPPPISLSSGISNAIVTYNINDFIIDNNSNVSLSKEITRLTNNCLILDKGNPDTGALLIKYGDSKTPSIIGKGIIKTRNVDSKAAEIAVEEVDTELEEEMAAALTINSDGSAAIIHKSGDLSGADLDSSISFDADKLKYLALAKDSSGLVEHEILHTGNITGKGYLTKSEIESIILNYNNGVDITNNGIPIGFEYFSFNPNIPSGFLPYTGGLYSRTIYKDLWAWVQNQEGYLISEEAWQDKYAQNSGSVPFYSTGNGVDTFRLPKITIWARGSENIYDIGKYNPPGLPNINASWSENLGYMVDYKCTGAVMTTNQNNGRTSAAANTDPDGGIFYFDASWSNPIYGSSDTVEPPSILGIWLVKAYGVIDDTGTIAIEDIHSRLEHIESQLDISLERLIKL